MPDDQTTWYGRPVNVVTPAAPDPDDAAVPDAIKSTLDHVVRLQAKIDKLMEARADAMAALVVSVDRWASCRPSSSDEAALEIAETLTAHSVPGRGRVRSLVGHGGGPGRFRFCVYALLCDGRIVYIGRSRGHQHDRVKFHHKAGKQFDEVLVYPCNDHAEMVDLEALLIDQHRPYHNKKREPRNGAAA